jgi:flagellar export protein FliJ
VKRLQKLVEIRETLAGAAEGPVRESEQRIRSLNETRQTIRESVQHARSEKSGARVQSAARLRIIERFINTLQARDASIQYNIERAEQTLEKQRRAWIEARREQKIAEKALERQSRQSQRTDEIALQRSMDDGFNAKGVLRKLKEE